MLYFSKICLLNWEIKNHHLVYGPFQIDQSLFWYDLHSTRNIFKNRPLIQKIRIFGLQGGSFLIVFFEMAPLTKLDITHFDPQNKENYEKLHFKDVINRKKWIVSL